MAWNEERVEILRKLWTEGLSASQIATKIGGITRNAVIGKVHRLGLAGRTTTSRALSGRPPRVPRASTGASAAAAKRAAPVTGKPRFGSIGGMVRPTYAVEVEPYTPSQEELVIPLAERRSIQTLTECSCRWPIGDPQLADFHFCGKDKVPGMPYCEFHAQRAFQPPQPRRRERETALPVFQAIARGRATIET